MTAPWRYFWVSLFLSLPFWSGINIFQRNLEDFLFSSFRNQDPELILAQINPEALDFRAIKPTRNSEIGNLNPEQISAKGAVVLSIDNRGREKILFQKEPDLKLPIASLTKLMTANVAIDSYDLFEPIIISKEAVAQEENFGQLSAGEQLTVKDLLYVLLMESSNDAAWALAEKMGPDDFTTTMNKTSEGMGLEQTYFVNPSGVDPDYPDTLFNYSTPRDLIKLAVYLLNEKSFVWEILNTSQIDLYLSDGALHHTLRHSINGLSYKFPNLLGGKTGWTPIAKGCLLLVQENPDKNGLIVYALLGSDDRFGEMEKLINWVNTAWQW